MRDLGADLVTHLQAREGVHKALAIWTAGRNRQTNAIEHFGFWTGTEDIAFDIDGDVRAYVGSGSLISIPPLVGEVGLRVRSTRINLSPLNAAVLSALRGYDPRGLPVELHVLHAQPGGGDWIGAPLRAGYLETAGLKLTDPAPGREASCELTVRSRSAFLTRALPLRKSDAALQARQPGDRIRRYADVSGVVETVWGTLRATTPPPTPTTPRPVQPVEPRTGEDR